ncbi:U6 snRNA phosphodiesterase Usb1 [Bisporella sp. PMI_857]|nr:U6 snRNA phosphodiesterase Usb1 [Bisporella sp. PMI_857]
MALVDYPSSDDEDNNGSAFSKTCPEQSTATVQSRTNLKRKHEPDGLPPLPSKFLDLYAATTRASTRDDASLHGGRKRATPHIQGNWPSHLYIEWFPSNTEAEILSNLISTLQATISGTENTLQSLLASDVGTALPLHISLSRPIGFSTDRKDDFVVALDRAIKSSGIRPFQIQVSDLDWVPNFEKTRWFLVFRIKEPETNGLNKLLHICNDVVQNYDQPPLYVDAVVRTTPKKKHTQHISRRNSKDIYKELQDRSNAFHFSIAWTLKPPDKDLLEATEAMVPRNLQAAQEIDVKVDEIKAKIGNVVTGIHLQSQVLERTGIFGF